MSLSMSLEFLNPSNLSWANYDSDWCLMLLCCIPCRFPKEQLWRQLNSLKTFPGITVGYLAPELKSEDIEILSRLTQGGKTQPTNPSLPSWGNACFWGWGMSNWCIYMLQWSWSPSYPNGTLGFPHCFRKKRDGVPVKAFSAAVNRYLGWNEDELIQYRLSPRGQVSWAEVKYCCNRQTAAWENDWNRVR